MYISSFVADLKVGPTLGKSVLFHDLGHEQAAEVLQILAILNQF